MKPHQLLPLSLGALLSTSFAASYDDGVQEPLRAAIDPNKYRAACPDYKSYSMRSQYDMLTSCETYILTCDKPA